MLSLDDDDWYFSTDTVEAAITPEKNEGVVALDDGSSEAVGDGVSSPQQNDHSVEFHWDATPTVDAAEVPSVYREFFDADEFRRLTATVVKSIPQTYVIGDSEYTFKKPPEELKKAAWSMDNKPWTLDHPDTKMVRDVDQIRGFWKNPVWDGDSEETNLTLFFPAKDDEARSYVEDNADVSIGFLNKLVGADEDGIDAYQTDIYTNHVASVSRGRCSGEDGCGIQTDHHHTHTTDITQSMMVGAAVTADSDDGDDDTTATITMTDTNGGCDCGADGDAFGVGDMTFDAVRSHNDSVDQEVAELEESIAEYQDAAKALEDVREAVDADDDASVTDAVEALVSDYEDATEALDTLRESRADEMRGEIIEHPATSFDEDEDLEERDYEWLEDKVGFLDDLEIETESGSETSPTTANADADGGGNDSTGEEVEIEYNTQY